MEELDLIQKRKQKIINWMKNPYNLAFLGILIFAFAIRLYYFILTKTQPLWWDEAEYMNMARHWAFGTYYVFDAVRQILFPFIISFFMKISTTLFFPRVFLLLLSMASVVGMYYLGKEIYDEKIGLLSAFFMSIFYLNIFFTYRLLVDMHSLTFFIFSALFFYKYLKNNSVKSLYIASALIAIGTLFKLSTAFIIPAIFIYVLITEKLNFLKKKEIWIAALIFLLILTPYFIWGYFEFNTFVLTKASAHVAPENYAQRLFGGSIDYFKLFPIYFSWFFLIIFLLGLASMYKLFLGFDVLIKQGHKELKRDLFLLLIFLIPLFLVSLMINHNENRYILNSLSIVFLISGSFIMRSYDFLKKQNKFFAILFLILLLGFTASFQLKSTDSLMKLKLNSYAEVREAGLFLQGISNESDIIATNSVPQIKYYAQRETIQFPAQEEEFESLLLSNENIKFYIVSAFENHPEWAYSYPQKKNLEVVQAYFADKTQQQPLLIIYKL